MTQTVEDALEAGRDALKRFAWSEAFELLNEADRESRLTPDDLGGLGECGWWLARMDDSITAFERAFAGYSESGQPLQAGLAAIWLTKNYFGQGKSTQAMAWFKRAERLIDEHPDALEYGYLLRMRAVMAHEGEGDYEAALGYAQQAYEIAERFQNRDLMAISIQDQGRALVGKGDVVKGMELMDEATVAAVSGELAPFWTAGIYCNMITACEELADFGRASEWSEAAKRWCERQAIAGFPGMCRVYRASIMRLHGDWAEAEREARRACDELTGFNASYAAAALYELGEIRLRFGDVAAAEEAFRQAHEMGRDPQPGLAFIRLMQGNVEAAVRGIERALNEESRDLYRARLLPAQAEILIEAGDLEAAAIPVAEAHSIAESYRTPALRAAADTAQGALHLAGGRAGEARVSLRRASRGWQKVDAPYELAETRTLLGQASVAENDPDAARLEFQAARTSFERLGAIADVRRVNELLGEEATSPSPADAHRTTRTFMFTDLAKSTNLVEAIGDDAWQDLVRWHDQTLRSLFAAHQGQEIDHAGDGFFVAFESASSSVECAVAIQRRLAEHRRTSGFAPSVRIGIHSSDASRSGSGYKGKGVHEAARISALAQGGEIVASSKTIEDQRLRFSVSDPRTVELKGISQPVEVVSISWR